MTVFLKSKRIASFKKTFVSNSYHLMKSKRLIASLKNELRSKNTIIKLTIENSKYNNECFENKNNNNSNQIEICVTPKKPCKTQNIRQ